MKKFIILMTCALFAIVTNAQAPETKPCSANWWAKCCKCEKCLVVDPLPNFGYCRHCNLLCPDCRKEIGDLDKALEELKEKNRKLYDELKKYQSDANSYNSKLTDALVRTYGQESGGWNKPSTWNLSGFNSSIGKFYTAEAAIVSNFSGVGLPMKLTTDVISILQTSNTKDAATNVGGTVLDILSTDGIIAPFEHELVRNAATKMVEEIRRARGLQGPALEKAVTQACKNFAREARLANMVSSGIKRADFGSTLYDIYSFIMAGAELISDLTDIYQNYTARQASLEKRLQVQKEIVKNVDLITCIKETQDSLGHGGLGVKSFPGNGFYAGKIIVGFLLPEISTLYYPVLNSGNRFFLQRRLDDPYWQIDTINIKSAISHLKQQGIILESMKTSFLNDIIPPLVPWIINRWQNLTPEMLVSLIKQLKSPLNVLITNYKKVKNLAEAIIDNLGHAVQGYESDYLVGGPDTISSGDKAEDKKLEINANEKIKGEFGRVNMSFPAGVDWSVDFYTPDNKYITNRSSFSKHQMFHDLTPGNYNIKLNHILIENVPVEKGKEIRLKSGIVSLFTRDPWELYDESKEKYYTSGNKPVKFALPVGIYQLKFEGKFYRVVIKDRVAVKFETPISLF